MNLSIIIIESKTTKCLIVFVHKDNTALNKTDCVQRARDVIVMTSS